MAEYITHKQLRAGRWVFDPAMKYGNRDGWRQVSTTPESYGMNGALIVWFVDGGAAIEKPGHRWITR